MAKQTDLFDLVQALTMSEKRYFKLFIKKQSTTLQNNHLRLFDAVNAMAQYDEARLKKKFAGQMLGKNLSAEKHYLHQTILKAMRAYQREKSAASKMKELLIDVDFLIEKSLFQQAYRNLQKVSTLAREMEDHLVWLECLDRERRLIKSLMAGETLAVRTRAIIAEKNEVMALLDTRLTYYDLYDELLLRLKTGGIGHADGQAFIGQLKEHPLLQLERKPESFYSGHFFHQLQAFLAHLDGDPESAHTHYAAAVSWWEEHSTQIEEHPNRFRSLIYNLVQSAYQIGRFEVMPPLMDRMAALPVRNPIEEGRAFFNLQFSRLLYIKQMCDFEAFDELLPSIEEGIERFQNDFNEAWQLSFYATFATVEFYRGKPKAASLWNNKILAMGKAKSRVDIRLFGHIFNVVLLFEQDDDQYLDYAIRAADRYIEKHSKDDSILLELMRYLRQLCRNKNDVREMQTLKAFRLFLETNPSQVQAVTGLNEINLWVKSKTENRSIPDLLKH